MSTSSKWKRSSGAKRKAGKDRPFSPAILARARAIAQKYQFVLWREDGEWYGRGVELPDAMNDGKTPEECIANVRDTFVTVVAYLLEKGQSAPAPASEKLRTMQVNVRLAPEEKLVMEAAAKQRGFEGLSDFMRVAALTAAAR